MCRSLIIQAPARTLGVCLWPPRAPDVKNWLVADTETPGASPAGGAFLPARASRPSRAADPQRPTQDLRIAQRIAARDERALTELRDRYSRAAYSLARPIYGDTHLFHDEVQEVFLAVRRTPDRYLPGRGAVSSWLLSVVHHKAVDAVRRETVNRRHQTVLHAAVNERHPNPSGHRGQGRR